MDLLKRQKEIEEQIAQLSRAYTGLQEQLNKTANALIKLQGALEENQRQIKEEKPEE